jgi:hypothetical protein
MPDLRLSERKILQASLKTHAKSTPVFSLPSFPFKKRYITPITRLKVVNFLGCWKWFNTVLKDAQIEITDQNKSKIDEVIHKYIGEQSSYGRCSADWKKARKEIKESPEMKQELIAQLKTLV